MRLLKTSRRGLATEFSATICFFIALGISVGNCQERPTFSGAAKTSSWLSAKQRCEKAGKRLCLRKDLCRKTSSTFTPRRTTTVPQRDTWVAVSDEYNDWTFLGLRGTKVCQKLSESDGPPSWGGKDCSNIAMKGKGKMPSFCSKPKGFYCCQNDSESQAPIPQPVHVYITSRMEGNTPQYHYSLKQYQNEENWLKDRAPWRNGGRLNGDLSKVTFMSGFVKDKFEDPIFFCVQSITMSNRLYTTQHRVSKVWCSFPWKLNFFLYGSFSELEDRESQKYLIGSAGSGNTAKTRISSRGNRLYPLKFTIFGPTLTNNEHIQTANAIGEECGQTVFLTSKTGIISSPNYPSKFNTRSGDVVCMWNIRAPPQSVVKIVFKTMKLHPERFKDYAPLQVRSFQTERVTKYNFNKLCPADKVEISGYGTFCGSERPPSFVTTENEIGIKFFGRRGSSGVSFALYYEIIDPPAGFSVMKISEDEQELFDWDWGNETCAKMGKVICNAGDICSADSRPFYGVKEGDQWAPISDEYNDWVQIGRGNVHTCSRHNKIYGPPRWGLSGQLCRGVSVPHSCPAREFLYCCEPPAPAPVPQNSMVRVSIYSTVQNNVVFFKYLRTGIDKPQSFDSSNIWTPNRKRRGDLVAINLYTKRSPGFDRVVYFCSKEVVPAIGRLRTAFAMFLKPCEANGWTFLYHLYAMNQRQTGAQRLFVGVYEKTPYHTRVNAREFPEDFESTDGYILYSFVKSEPPDEDVQSDSDSVACKGNISVITAPSILESPGYPASYEDNAKCRWLIRLPGESIIAGHRLKVTIEELSLEDPVDVLTVYELAPTFDLSKSLPDGNELSSLKERKDFTGMVAQVSLYTQAFFLLSFTSDNSISDKGFRVKSEIITDECGREIVKHGDVITSPNYPLPYSGKSNCKWFIRPPSEKHHIQIEFQSFDLIADENCSDSVRVIGKDSGIIRLFCGGAFPPKRIKLEDDHVNVTFTTIERSVKEQVKGGKGFAIKVFFLENSKNSFAAKKEMPQCGIQSVPFQRVEAAADRVVRGKVADNGNFPWLVMIGRPDVSCGGTLVNDRFVLSATHCFVNSLIASLGLMILHAPLNRFVVIAGRYKRNIPSPGEQIFNISSLSVHGGFQRYAARWQHPSGITVRGIFPYNDIALAELSEKVVFSPTISPACLPRQDAIVGDFCYVAGWGSVSPDRVVMASAVRYARVPILDNSLCNGWEEMKGTIMENALCAGFPEGRSDHCWGDSGGALMCRGRYGNFYINGIVSWSRECAGRRTPGVYTRVWKYVDWIEEVLAT